MAHVYNMKFKVLPALSSSFAEFEPTKLANMPGHNSHYVEKRATVLAVA